MLCKNLKRTCCSLVVTVCRMNKNTAEQERYIGFRYRFNSSVFCDWNIAELCTVLLVWDYYHIKLACFHMFWVVICSYV